MNKWIPIKAVLLACIAAAASRPIPSECPPAAPPPVYLLIAGISFVIYVFVTPLILKLFPSTKAGFPSVLWTTSPVVPASFAHLLAWVAFAFSLGLIASLFLGSPATDDVLIPLSASIGSGLGILAGIAVLKTKN